MQPAERDEHTSGPVQVRHAVRAVGVRDVDLDDDDVGGVVDRQRLDVLVDDPRPVVGGQIRGERGEAERREQGVFDRAPMGAGRFRESREDELYAEQPVCARHLDTLH